MGLPRWGMHGGEDCAPEERLERGRCWSRRQGLDDELARSFGMPVACRAAASRARFATARSIPGMRSRDTIRGDHSGYYRPEIAYDRALSGKLSSRPYPGGPYRYLSTAHTCERLSRPRHWIRSRIEKSPRTWVRQNDPAHGAPHEERIWTQAAPPCLPAPPPDSPPWKDSASPSWTPQATDYRRTLPTPCRHPSPAHGHPSPRGHPWHWGRQQRR